MELPGIGFDLIEIERLERAIERRPRLAERIFSEAEIEFAEARRRPGRHLAARFAAKEAAQKALGLGGMRLHEIEVEGGGDRPPRLASAAPRRRPPARPASRSRSRSPTPASSPPPRSSPARSPSDGALARAAVRRRGHAGGRRLGDRGAAACRRWS